MREFKSGSRERVRIETYLPFWEYRDTAFVLLSIYLENDKGKRKKIGSGKFIITHDKQWKSILCKIPKVKNAQVFNVMVEVGDSSCQYQLIEPVKVLP